MDFATIWPYLVLALLIVIASRLLKIANLLSEDPKVRQAKKEEERRLAKEGAKAALWIGAACLGLLFVCFIVAELIQAFQNK